MNGDNDDPDHFDPYLPPHSRVTKMPPLNKLKNQGSQHDSAAHKNYAPLPWNAYFDELFFLSDVPASPFRALQSSARARKVSSSSASMAQDTPPSALRPWLER